MTSTRTISTIPAGIFSSAQAACFTTIAGAKRLGGYAEGLAPWDSTELTGKDGRSLTITATPARHGPAGIEPLSGDVIGFVVTSKQQNSRPIYITGDTVWYDGVAEVARRFKAGVVLPFAGAAQTRGPFHLTMDTNDAIETARAFPDAVIVPLHTDGWAHFRQNGDDLKSTFDTLGFGSRLKLLVPALRPGSSRSAAADCIRLQYKPYRLLVAVRCFGQRPVAEPKSVRIVGCAVWEQA